MRPQPVDRHDAEREEDLATKIRRLERTHEGGEHSVVLLWSPAARSRAARCRRRGAGLIADDDNTRRTAYGTTDDVRPRVAVRAVILREGRLLLVNGRRILLEGDALTAFLRQAPASALERVDRIDASRIGVTVSGGEVTLDGTVDGKGTTIGV